jgi:hypothetical protein
VKQRASLYYIVEGNKMNTDTQTLLRLIAKAEVAKNHADEAQRVADIKARGIKAMAEATNKESM